MFRTWSWAIVWVEEDAFDDPELFVVDDVVVVVDVDVVDVVAVVAVVVVVTAAPWPTLFF